MGEARPPGECSGVEAAMLWAECDGERSAECEGERRAEVGERCGEGGRVRVVGRRWAVEVGERPMGEGRGTSRVDMLSKVTRGTERDRCLKGGGVASPGTSTRS